MSGIEEKDWVIKKDQRRAIYNIYSLSYYIFDSLNTKLPKNIPEIGGEHLSIIVDQVTASYGSKI